MITLGSRASDFSTHDKFKTFLKLFDKAVGFGKVITVVRVAHDNPLAKRGTRAADDRVAITFFFHGDDVCAECFANGLRTVSAAVVGD